MKVKNREKPTQSKISALISWSGGSSSEKVHILQTISYQFKRIRCCSHTCKECRTNLESHSQQKLALPREPRSVKLNRKETCGICFGCTENDKMFSIDVCSHRYCFSCMNRHVEEKFLNGMVAECPHKGCNLEVKVDSCAKFLAPELVQTFERTHKRKL